MNENLEVYDLIIIGAGPAGLTASIYASCFHLKHVIIGKEVGGQMLFAPDILNYPGFADISGKELTQRMVEQVKIRGGELITQSVTRINQLSNQPISKLTNNNLTMKKLNNESEKENIFEIKTQEGNKYQAKAIILATGTERRKLGVPGEVEYTARGVHYCATCENFDYEGKVCAVIGGANSAVQAAVELAQAAKKVYLLYRGTQLRGDPIWIEQVEKNPKIEVIYNTSVEEIVGDGQRVTGVQLQITNNRKQITENDQSTTNPQPTTHNPQPTERLLPLDKVFIEIGGVPGTALVIPLGVKMDPGGYIQVNERLVTNIAGIFAAGDLVSYELSIEQISSAVGLGARAASSAFAYVKQSKAPIVWGASQIKR